VLFGFSLMLASVYLPFMQKLFDTVPLTLPWLMGVVAFGVVNIILIELTKPLFRKE
jgi:hypothetical protein